MANFTQNMTWNQNILPDGLICIFPGLLLLEHLGGMLFVPRNVGNAEPGQGMGISEQDFLLGSGWPGRTV